METISIYEATRLLHDKLKYISSNSITSYCRKGLFKSQKIDNKYHIDFNSFKIFAFEKYYVTLELERLIELRNSKDNYHVN